MNVDRTVMDRTMMSTAMMNTTSYLMKRIGIKVLFDIKTFYWN
jgi:hypothetical protein